MRRSVCASWASLSMLRAILSGAHWSPKQGPCSDGSAVVLNPVIAGQPAIDGEQPFALRPHLCPHAVDQLEPRPGADDPHHDRKAAIPLDPGGRGGRAVGFGFGRNNAGGFLAAVAFNRVAPPFLAWRLEITAPWHGVLG